METVILMIAVVCFMCIGYTANGYMLGLIRIGMGKEYKEAISEYAPAVSLFMAIPYSMVVVALIFVVLSMFAEDQSRPYGSEE